MKTGIAAIALCALLAGCQTPSAPTAAMQSSWQPQQRRDCSFSSCTTLVRVVNGQVEVDTQEIKMVRGARDVPMRWAIDTPGYEFRPSGDFLAPIIFKDANAPDAPTQFGQRRIGPRGQTVMIVNQNTNSTKYTYKVRVYRQGGGDGDFLETDPVIFNDF